MDKELILGIDTSNYTTSAATIDQAGSIINDNRKLLRVPEGMHGLRQSNALFQHVSNLPDIINDTLSGNNEKIAAVCCSNRPRPMESSYMPCFNAGISISKCIATALNVPWMCFSHQEGHIEAIRKNSAIGNSKKLLCWHLSGGTCELLKVDFSYSPWEIKIIGGSLDISFGQLLDRIGVSIGIDFPSGKRMDEIACNNVNPKTCSNFLTEINIKDNYFSLSGTETQCHKIIEGKKSITNIELLTALFERIAECIKIVTANAAKITGIYEVLFSGGVSSSNFIRNFLKQGEEFKAYFDNNNLSSDNAVGIALLGGEKYKWL